MAMGKTRRKKHSKIICKRKRDFAKTRVKGSKMKHVRKV